MGACCVINTNSLSKYDEIESELTRPPLRHLAVLFGIAGSGKSTICKQMHLLFNKCVTQSYNDYILIHEIRQNCVDHMIALCHMANDELFVKSVKLLNELSVDKDSDLSEISNIISSLWKQETIKSKYALRYFYYNYDLEDNAHVFMFDENIDSFFDQIEQIMSSNFVPNAHHFLKHKSSNYKSTTFYALPIDEKCELPSDEQHNIEFIDLGNFETKSKIYYKHHLSMFDELWFMLFVAGLSDFCVFDNNKSIILESIKYFKFIVNLHCSIDFYQADFLLIFTKADIFAECIKNGHSMKQCFEDFNGIEYFNSKLTNVVSFLCRKMYIKYEISRRIPKTVENIMTNYLVNNKTFFDKDDNTYFDMCYQESLKFIMDKYLQHLSRDIRKRITIIVVNAMDDADIKSVMEKMSETIRWHRAVVKNPLLLSTGHM